MVIGKPTDGQGSFADERGGSKEPMEQKGPTREEIRAKMKAAKEAEKAKIASYKHYELSPLAKKLFEDEKGLQFALQFLAGMAGKANKEAWEEVYAQYPELEGAFAVFDEEKNDIYVVPESELNHGINTTNAANLDVN